MQNSKETRRKMHDALEDAQDKLVVLKDVMRELLSAHDNLYVAHFGPNSDPVDDLAARAAREWLDSLATPTRAYTSSELGHG